MLTILLGILSSSGVGSIIGLAGGLINRILDQKNKAADQVFELQKMDKEHSYMLDEAKAKLEVAVQEGESAETVAGYGAMAKSYEFARTSSADGMVDKFSKFVRPFLTLAFFFFTMYIFYQVNGLVKELALRPTPEQVWNIYVYIVQWIFFQAGAAIGWWFAMRPGKSPSFILK